MNKNPPPARKPVRLPLHIGVTGHRDLRGADRDALAQEVKKVLETLDRKYPSTRLSLISPLAEGADQLVARVALELGLYLVVPLPLPKKIYEQQFTSSSVCQEFNQLLQKADVWFELPLGEGITEASLGESAEHRAQQYAAGAKYVAQHSQILLALWDGEEPIYPEDAKPRTGTGRTIKHKLCGTDAEARSPLDPVDSGPVYHVLTKRGEPPRLEGIYPQTIEHRDTHQAAAQRRAVKREEKAFERILRRIDQFNQDTTRLEAKLIERRREGAERLIPQQRIDQADLSPAYRVLRTRYSWANALAIYFQRRTVLSLFVLLVLTFLATFFYVYSRKASSPFWFQAAYPLTIVAGSLWYWWAWARAYEKKFLDYRALAEALRVQVFWRLAGIHDSVADHYLRKHRGELQWVRHAVKAFNIPAALKGTRMRPLRKDVPASRLRLVRDCWVSDQQRYHEKTGRKRKHQIVYWLVVILVLLAVGVLSQFLLAAPMFLPPAMLWARPIGEALGLTPLFAALILIYVRNLAYAEQAKQYARMHRIFSVGKMHLDQLLERSDRDRTQELIFDLGREALAENGDWVIMMRDRTLEIRAPYTLTQGLLYKR